MTAAAAKVSPACAHCGAPIERGIYCCTGCEVAADIIRGAGLDRYYAERTAPAPRPVGDTPTAWSEVPTEALDGGCRAATLRVDGLTCAACAWVTERVLQATPGVREATVSLTTGRTRVEWDPDVVDLERITARVAALGYRPRAAGALAPPDRTLLVRLGVAAFVAMNVMLLSASLYAGWFDGMDERYAALFRWTSLALATPAVLWCAEPMLTAAWAGLRVGVLHMDLPVSVGILAMYGHGVVATLRGEDAWLDSLTMLIALLLAGRVAEQGGRRRAVEAATALAGTAPRSARLEDGRSVPADTLAWGQRIVVATGEEVAADGVVVQGEGRVRMALLTGESEPAKVGEGDRVVAGAVLEEGPVVVRVEAAGEGTLVARMAAELAKAADRPAPPALTDELAPWFTAGTLGAAGVAFVAWGLAAGWPQGARIAMAVLVVACPCALALASPLATAAGLGAAARRGLLVRSGEALRALAEVEIVALDKTGTLTRGEPEVVAGDDVTVRIAAALERGSAHPVARAVLREAARRGIPLPDATAVVETIGVGVRGQVDGVSREVRRGAGPGEIEVVGVGTLKLRDTLRPDAARTVAALKARGLRVVLVSGDHAEVVEAMGRAAGVDEVVGAVGPEAKAAWVRAQPGKVMFVGDGVNDGPALAAAHVGVAMGAGAASSVLVADAVVAEEGLGPVLAGLRAAAAARDAVRANARRSVVYNVSAVGAALAGLVNPLVAAVLMPVSSGLVLWGASRVERST